MESPENGELERTNEDKKYDLASILCVPNRDFLVRNNGDQVISESVFCYLDRAGWLWFVAI